MTKLKSLNKKILIGGAWPYANGSLHLGHIAGLLAGDVIARYYRLTGADVVFVSGSDSHGTPISVKAMNEGVKPSEIVEKYHNEFKETFKTLGFSYDLYTLTMDDYHKEKVTEFFIKLHKKGFLYPKKVKMAFCPECNRFLPDRYLIGTCHNCGYTGARGDQCDECGTLIDVEKLQNKKCTICQAEPEIRETEHLFFALSKFQKELERLVQVNESRWRKNAVGLAKRYLTEGVIDRAVTRDLDWGIDVPLEGFAGKKIYVWFEAVLGYITATMKLLQDNPQFTWEEFWSKEAISYYVHGKDNIPFHTIILPALLMGLDIHSLPAYIISSEYLTIEGKKISTSRNWAIWVNDYLSRYDPDPLRYFLIINGPETRDSDFSWSEFLERNNGELLGAYGNLVNRTLTQVRKNFGGRIPEAGVHDQEDAAILERCKSLYDSTGELIEKGELKEALKEVFEVIRATNKYIDTKAPWSTIKTDRDLAATTLKVCLDAIINLSSVCYPFLPHITEKALGFLNETPEWEYRELTPGGLINEPALLVKRLDKSIIAEEVGRLGKGGTSQ